MEILSKIGKILTPPTFDNEIKNRQARNLYTISILLISVFSIGLIIIVLSIGVDYFIVSMISGLIMYIFGCMILVKKDFLNLASFLVPLCLTIVFSVASFTRGGLNNSVIFLHVIPILLAGLLLGFTWSLAFAILSILLAFILLLVMKYTLYEFPLEPVDQIEVKLVILIIAIMTVIIFPYLTSKDRFLTATQRVRFELESIVSVIKDPVVSINLNLQLILHNSASQTIFTENVKNSFVENLKPIIEKIDPEIEISSKFSNEFENTFLFRGDDNTHYKVNIFFIVGKNSLFDRLLCIVEDISDEYKIDKIKTEFISTVAHELRTPLTSIMGFSELLLTKKGISSDEKIKFLQYILDKSTNMKNLINDLLDIATIESGERFQLNLEECIVGDGIKDVMKTFSTAHPDFTFHFDLVEKTTLAIVDKAAVKRVCLNLLDNAVKYSGDKKNIWIKSEVEDNFYILHIKDEGIGLTKQQMSRLFTKFYRADASNSAIEGTGLGLVISKNIIELHGGKINVESEFARGSKFSFSLPLIN